MENKDVFIIDELSSEDYTPTGRPTSSLVLHEQLCGRVKRDHSAEFMRAYGASQAQIDKTLGIVNLEYASLHEAGQRGSVKQTTDKKLVLADFAEIESRVMAHYSSKALTVDADYDKALVEEMFESGKASVDYSEMLTLTEYANKHGLTVVIVGEGVSAETVLGLKKAGLKVLRRAKPEPLWVKTKLHVENARGKGPRGKYGKLK